MTINNSYVSGGVINSYTPEPACFNWCVEQHIVHSNNLEVWVTMFIVVSYFLILITEWAFEIERLKKYQRFTLYMAKIMLLLFFLAYFLFIRWKVF